jgi:hypothetical protein
MQARWLAILALAGTLTERRARADTPTTVDTVEHIFGASNTNAVAGHGGLTAGISVDGDLTVLSWPGPSFADQLQYLSSNDLDVRTKPHLGALDGMGSYVGLLVTTAQGTQLVWLRDAAFAHVQRYTQPDAPVVETTFTRADLSLQVVLTDIVSPDVDLLTRRLVVTRLPGSPVLSASLVLYENLSPTVSRIPMLPLADWLFDSRNDFVAVYDRAAGAVVHVHPADRGVVASPGDLGNDPTAVDYGPVEALMKRTPTDADVDALLAGLDAAFPPGVAALVTTEPTPSSFQVGSDATPFCAQAGHLADNLAALPAELNDNSLSYAASLGGVARCTDALPSVQSAHGWTWAPMDALSNLATGTLSGSRLAACQTNAALVASLTFQGDVAEGSALFAFAKSVAAARATLQQGTGVPASARQAAAEKAAHDALASVALPDPSLGPRTTLVAQRSLVNIYVARDRATGAIVASISHQPPYYLDWPRDGSFFLHAIDVAGLLPWGTARAEWYVGLQRREVAKGSFVSSTPPTDPDSGAEEFPAFAWEMNYYGDGTIGGNIRFEIDNTALHVWAVVVHAAALGPSDRAAYVAAVWPTLKDALGLLIRWRDPNTGLPWPANEDDSLTLTSTLHGATAVYAALVAGARLGHFVGDEATAGAALSRSIELQQAIVKTYYDPSAGLFRDAPQDGGAFNPGSAGNGDTGWLAWPARVLDPNDPRLEAQLMADMTSAMKDIRGETQGSAYVMKNVVAAALLGKDGGSRDLARQAVQMLADIATPDTMQFGEVFVTTPAADGGAPVFSDRVATPHVWEGTLFYLSAMALSAPERFDPEIIAMPLPAAGDYRAGGGCDVARHTPLGTWLTSATLAGIALGALAAFRARRRRRDLPPLS